MCTCTLFGRTLNEKFAAISLTEETVLACLKRLLKCQLLGLKFYSRGGMLNNFNQLVSKYKFFNYYDKPHLINY